MNKILLIGCGHMGSALLNAWHSKTSNNFTVIDPNKYKILRKTYRRKVSTFKSIEIIKKSGGLLRLPGQGGMADVSNLHQNFICYVTRHSKLSFVEKVDYVSAGRALFKDKERIKAGFKPGKVKIFTNLCIFEKSKKTGFLEVISIHKDVTKKNIEDNTGFKILYNKQCKITPLPSKRELKMLREEVDPLNIRKLEFVSGKERMELFKEILKNEKKLIKNI